MDKYEMFKRAQQPKVRANVSSMPTVQDVTKAITQQPKVRPNVSSMPSAQDVTNAIVQSPENKANVSSVPQFPAPPPPKYEQPQADQQSGSEQATGASSQKPAGSKKVTTEQVNPKTGEKTIDVKVTEPAGQPTNQGPAASATIQGQEPAYGEMSAEEYEAMLNDPVRNQEGTGISQEESDQIDAEYPEVSLIPMKWKYQWVTNKAKAFINAHPNILNEAASQAGEAVGNYIGANPQRINAVGDMAIRSNVGVKGNASDAFSLQAKDGTKMPDYKAGAGTGMGDWIFGSADRARVLDDALKASAMGPDGNLDANKYQKLKADSYRLMLKASTSKDPKERATARDQLIGILGKNNVLTSFFNNESNWNVFLDKIKEGDPLFTRWMIDMQNSFREGTDPNADASSLKPFWDSLGKERQQQLISACKTSMWNNLKKDPLKMLPQIISLWFRSKGWDSMADYAEDPLKFYLTALGILGGGALLLGGAFSGGGNQQPVVVNTQGGNANPLFNGESRFQ